MREDVLQIEFQPVFDKWAWRITFQNEDVLKRGEFTDRELNCESCDSPEFLNGVLFIKGKSEEYDDKINLCTTKEKTSIEEKVRGINKKYGIKKRWRGKRDEKYYYVDTYNGYVATTSEKGFEDDDFNHEIGNYFKTLELAEKYLSDLKEFSRKWHEKNGSYEKEEE